MLPQLCNLHFLFRVFFLKMNDTTKEIIIVVVTEKKRRKIQNLKKQNKRKVPQNASPFISGTQGTLVLRGRCVQP